MQELQTASSKDNTAQFIQQAGKDLAEIDKLLQEKYARWEELDMKQNLSSGNQK